METKFSEKFKELRKKEGLTQKEIASIFGVGHSAISKWENDDNYPTAAMLNKIADFFNISLDELLNGNIPQTTAEIDPNASDLDQSIAMLKQLDRFNLAQAHAYITELLRFQNEQKEKFPPPRKKSS